MDFPIINAPPFGMAEKLIAAANANESVGAIPAP
jgi:hypothetical protein